VFASVACHGSEELVVYWSKFDGSEFVSELIPQSTSIRPSSAPWRYDMEGLEGSYREFRYKLALPGSHQVENSSLAIAATSLIGIDTASQQEGLANAFWPGRCEWVRDFQGRDILMDAAHNPDGMSSLSAYLTSVKTNSVDVIFSALDGKDWKRMIDRLSSHIVNWHLVKAPHGTGVPAQELAEYISGQGLADRVHIHEKGCEQCLSDIMQTPGNRPLLITGSMYLIGALRPIIVSENKPLWVHRDDRVPGLANNK
jgi:dihydrofolate synthase / folylpolyglutamate synthase